MDLVRFREVVRQAQEPQGYFFNAEQEPARAQAR